ncbi:MAG: hypothetical protein IPI14_10520 [Polaromonas sp.]|nr:hypothetical protein [Polaromonas sp.]
MSPKYTSIPGDDNQKNGLSNSLANNASSEPATIQSSTLKVDNPIPGIDFGGMKYVAGMDLAQWDVVARLGKIKEPNGFSLAGLLGISKAYAATPKNNLPQNCWNDSPQRYNTATGEIKSLASKQTVAVKRYLDSSETYMGYDKGELGANIGTHYFRVSI